MFAFPDASGSAVCALCLTPPAREPRRPTRLALRTAIFRLIGSARETDANFLALPQPQGAEYIGRDSERKPALSASPTPSSDFNTFSNTTSPHDQTPRKPRPEASSPVTSVIRASPGDASPFAPMPCSHRRRARRRWRRVRLFTGSRSRRAKRRRFGQVFHNGRTALGDPIAHAPDAAGGDSGRRRAGRPASGLNQPDLEQAHRLADHVVGADPAVGQHLLRRQARLGDPAHVHLLEGECVAGLGHHVRDG